MHEIATSLITALSGGGGPGGPGGPGGGEDPGGPGGTDVPNSSLLHALVMVPTWVSSTASGRA